MQTAFHVQNLKCGGCAKTITENISAMSGILEVSVDIDKSEVHVAFKNESIPHLVEKSLSSMGYLIVGDKNSIFTKTKSLVSCASGKLIQ